MVMSKASYFGHLSEELERISAKKVSSVQSISPHLPLDLPTKRLKHA